MVDSKLELRRQHQLLLTCSAGAVARGLVAQLGITTALALAGGYDSGSLDTWGWSIQQTSAQVTVIVAASVLLVVLAGMLAAEGS
ncbi:MAG: hypothetical protein KDC39_08510 [Actinobacteria bacterium]|nr:hypothetical protein [Actinomycetota bacterium]